MEYRALDTSPLKPELKSSPLSCDKVDQQLTQRREAGRERNVFRGSVGRTDFPLSDPAAMKASLRKVMLLPDETKVFVGHMEPTSIGHERRRNPFVKQALG
jgi:hypothetical protein